MSDRGYPLGTLACGTCVAGAGVFLSFPAKRMIRDWLTAGVFEPGKGFGPTEEETPQSGVSSPLLLNAAMHGLEEAAGSATRQRPARRPRPGPDHQ